MRHRQAHREVRRHPTRAAAWDSGPDGEPASGGLQLRNARDEWELTERGQQWAEALPYCRHGHSGDQILWNPAVVNIVRELG